MNPYETLIQNGNISNLRNTVNLLLEKEEMRPAEVFSPVPAYVESSLADVFESRASSIYEDVGAFGDALEGFSSDPEAVARIGSAIKGATARAAMGQPVIRDSDDHIIGTIFQAVLAAAVLYDALAAHLRDEEKKAWQEERAERIKTWSPVAQAASKKAAGKLCSGY